MACGIDVGRPAWPLLSPEVDFVPVGPGNTDGLIIVSPFAFEAGERYARDLISSGFPAKNLRPSSPAMIDRPSVFWMVCGKTDIWCRRM
jgi:hypothetical protein